MYKFKIIITVLATLAVACGNKDEDNPLRPSPGSRGRRSPL